MSNTGAMASKLEAIKSRLDACKQERAKAEANKEHYEKQVQEIEAAMQEQGVTPGTIEERIQALRADIDKRVQTIESLLEQAEKVIRA